MTDDTENGFDGERIARQRIAEEAKKRSGIIDLGRLGLHELPAELFRLKHLRGLFLGERFRRGDREWENASANGPPNRIAGGLRKLSGLAELRDLSVAGADVESLDGLAELQHLRALDISRTQVTELEMVAALKSLQQLDIAGTQVSDLAPLAALAGLQNLFCSYAPVSDLTPLRGLANLRRLDCSSTDVTDLAPLAEVTKLELVDCSYTSVSTLAPLAGLAGMQRVLFAGTQVDDLAPLAGLAKLQWCDCCHTQVSDLSPLSGAVTLQRLLCSGSQVTDLSPVAGLTAMQVLFCSETEISDVRPMAGMTKLRALDCTSTKIVDLAPLAGLSALAVLHCSQTQIASLAPLKDLKALQVLYFSGTPVRDLAPLKDLKALQVLSCAHTGVGDLAALDGMTALREFSCADTQVGSLAPLKSSIALTWFSCANTRVADLAPVAGMRSLLWFSCAGTEVKELAPLADLRALRWLDGSECRLKELPQPVWGLEGLHDLYLFRSSVEQVPAEVLSQSKRDNCLEALRAHYADLAEGEAAVPDVKLVILGNGRVGKTQLSRKLRHEEFQAQWDTTHGIAVRPGELAHVNGESAARLQIWDFGGQDIYHGTHALFLRTRAVFVITWASDVEATPEYEHQGIRFQNHPLAYWLEYVRQFGDKDSPVLIVQTKADTAADDVVPLPLEEAARENFGYVRVLQYSSANDRGRTELNAALHDAVTWLREPERQGSVKTGAGRLRMRRRLESLREADAELPVVQRKYRTLERLVFREICDQEGGIGSNDQLLSYLNNTGAVFHRRGLFHEQIVLDQAWALDAIYAVFQRDKCYRQLVAAKGRFTRQVLHDLVWREHAVSEQRLFLSMMLSCGICFIHRGNGLEDETTEYVAPELLPDRSVEQARLDQEWDENGAQEVQNFTYILLPPGLLRGVSARIGQSARENAIYWRDGVCVYETTLRAHGVIEQVKDETWGGTIRVRTQGRGAAALLERLVHWIGEEQARAGLNPDDVVLTPPRIAGWDDDRMGLLTTLTEAPLVFGRVMERV